MDSLISFQANTFTRRDRSIGCTVARDHFQSLTTLRTYAVPLLIGHCRAIKLLRLGAGERMTYVAAEKQRLKGLIVYDERLTVFDLAAYLRSV